MHRHSNNHNHSQGSLPPGRPVIPEEEAKASDCFEQFLTASTLKTILGSYRNICEYLHLKPNVLPLFYPKLKAHIKTWKAKPLWKKFDLRANQKCYGRGKACPHTRVLVIGAGPCGLRTAIEAQLLGAKVVVVEKRDRMSRNNVLHLWPFVIDDLRALGAKKFFGKFCAGAIDHISIRQLQCILLKVALLLGVEIHTEVSFERLIEPNPSEKTGWRAECKPTEHPVAQFEFDVIIGADGKRNTLQGFKRKEFRGKLAIAITANFINKRTEAEARVEEISGVAFIFNQKFFKDLYADTGIDLENIVYYKDDTHYFVMTAKKQSLIDKGVIREDLSDTEKLLAPDNVNREKLMNYAREAADFSTNYQMPDLEFAVNHYGQPDVAMFDFTSMYAAEDASRVMERHGYKLLTMLVGDSLLEPFWPTGSGCARGFLSSMDAAWAIRSWGSEVVTPLEVMAERESIYRLLAQTTPENLNKDYKSYTIDPSSRYPNLNKNALLPHQVTSQYDTDDPKSIELNPRPAPVVTEVPKKRRRRESHVDPDTLLSWIKEQIREHEDLEVANITTSFKDGRILCAIINHYRPDLLDYSAINAHDFSRNNQVAFDLLEKELGIPPVMTGEEMANKDSPDFSTMLSYLTKIYDTFRGEIPHIKYPKWDMPEIKRNDNVFKVHTAGEYIKAEILSTIQPARPSSRHKRHVDTSFLTKSNAGVSQDRKARKRKTLEKVGASVEDRQKKYEEIVANRVDRQNKRRQQRKMQTDQFIKSMQMLHSNCKPDHSEPFEDYSIYLYRQTAPNFEDRVKDLEKKFIYVPDKEGRVMPAQMKRETDEDFAARIKDIEEKCKEPVPVEKKPKDLRRAIGKIETSDWNIKEIEKKIIENKMGKSVNKDKEKVPKWSREQFLARQTKMERQHLDRQDSAEVKFAEIDKNIKQLELKLKEGSIRDLNQQKVATITEKLVGKSNEISSTPQPKPVEKPQPRTVISINQTSDFCHFCSKRVYLVERLSAEGKVFHTGCFRCQYCHTSLRLGSYMFDREGVYGHRFYCTQHYGLPGEIEIIRPEKKVLDLQEASQNKATANVIGIDLLDRVQTPERIEFSNLSTGHVSSDHDESPSPIDEDEWTDRNNINSVIDSDSSDDSSSSSDTDTDDETYEEALEEPITKEGTLRWAERYKKRYSHKDDSDSDGYSSSDHFSYYENSSGDDDSDTATEGEEEIRARELRKQEVRVEPPIDAGTDTEVKPLSNFPFDPHTPNLISNQNLCSKDMPDILNNTLKISKSSDNTSSNYEFNSAESEIDELCKTETQSILSKQEVNKEKTQSPNVLSKSVTTSSITTNPVKRNFVIPPKDRRKSFGKEFVPVVESEPLLIIKRTPSKINLPPELGKPKVQIKPNLVDTKKYFGQPSKPCISKPPIDISRKSQLFKQKSLPERTGEVKFGETSNTKRNEIKQNIGREERKQSLYNFEPEESDIKDIDNYIECLMKNKNELLKTTSCNDDENEKVSSSIEDLLKALEIETSVRENEMVADKSEEKIDDLLTWIEELDHKAVETDITSSLKPDKYKNLEDALKKPKQVDTVIHRLSKDNISLFESHLLGKDTSPSTLKSEKLISNNFQLSKSRTEVDCNKRKSSIDLDAVKKVDIKKVLQKFENSKCKSKEDKPKKDIFVPQNIVKRNSFANYTFNRSFEKDDKLPMYTKHRNSVGSKDFKLKTEMFENKARNIFNVDNIISKPQDTKDNIDFKDNEENKLTMNIDLDTHKTVLKENPLITNTKCSQTVKMETLPMDNSNADFDSKVSLPEKSFLGAFNQFLQEKSKFNPEPLSTIETIACLPVAKGIDVANKIELDEVLINYKPNIISYDPNSQNNMPKLANEREELTLLTEIQSNSRNNADTSCDKNDFDLKNEEGDEEVAFDTNTKEETPFQDGENYFQALITVKNIVRNFDEYIDPTQNTESLFKEEYDENTNINDDIKNITERKLSDNEFCDRGKNTESLFKKKIKEEYDQNTNINDDIKNITERKLSYNEFCDREKIKNSSKDMKIVEDNASTNQKIIDNLETTSNENNEKDNFNKKIPCMKKIDEIKLVANMFDTNFQREREEKLCLGFKSESGQNSCDIKSVEKTHDCEEINTIGNIVNTQDSKLEFDQLDINLETPLAQCNRDVDKMENKSHFENVHPFWNTNSMANKETSISITGTIDSSNEAPKISSNEEIVSPLVPLRLKREQQNMSMIPRLIKNFSDNKCDPLAVSNVKDSIKPVMSVRAASASPGVSRRMDSTFAPIPPVRRKISRNDPTTNLFSKNTKDTSCLDVQKEISINSELPNLNKLSEKSASADNIQIQKRKHDTLKNKIFSSKEKECLIQ